MNYNAEKFDTVVKSSIMNWKVQPKRNFDLQPLLTKGKKDNPTMIITEFADFLCGHCRQTSPKIKYFAKSHPDVQVRFYAFPLDGTCNDVIQRKNGVSCRLTKVVYCSQSQKIGWKVHDMIFEKQKEFYDFTNNLDGLDSHLQKTLSKIKGFQWKALKSCIESETTHNAIVSQAALGVKVDVQGTPTIFVNGRKLPGGNFIPVLEAAYQDIKNK